MNFALWLPIFAAVLVALYHSLSDDGAASILDHFGIRWRLPPSALPVVILAFGVASGTVSSVVEGKDWQTALAAAVTTAIAGIFGAVTQHAIVNRTVPRALGAVVFLLLGLSLAACPAAIEGSCVVIRAADDVCAMITVPGPDGGLPMQVKVSGPELRAFAHERAAAHLQEGAK